MKNRIVKKVCLTILPLLVSRSLSAQNLLQIESPNFAAPDVQLDAPVDDQVIFSNLGPTVEDKFNSVAYPFGVAGRSAGGGAYEAADAIAFMPKVNARAKVLLAAIGYISGVNNVLIGLYSDSAGTVGAPLPGGVGGTTQMADVGVCCQLTKVTLPGAGVALNAGTRYWLVAFPGDPTFSGGWQLSYRGGSAFLAPPNPWGFYPGQWPAGEIRGTLSPRENKRTVASPASSPAASRPAANVTIFSNLGPTTTDLYIAGAGFYVAGKDALQSPELWLALPFTAKTNSHAQTLAAAIGYQSGAMKVNLGLYSDDNGQVGVPLTGGQGSTIDIPPAGDCCGLATVTLSGSGVALAAGTQYWLVASPDDVNAPTFQAIWQESNLALTAYMLPQKFIDWTNVSGDWLAAKIRGTVP